MGKFSAVLRLEDHSSKRPTLLDFPQSVQMCHPERVLQIPVLNPRTHYSVANKPVSVKSMGDCERGGTLAEEVIKVEPNEE